MARTDWDTYFLDIAQAVAARADCRRAQHGAVIVKDHRIRSTGYNATAKGSLLSCLDGDCPRATAAIPMPSLHADYSNCINQHAEQNAIGDADRADCVDATIYITGEPCDMCRKLIRAAGINWVVYRDRDGQTVKEEYL